MPFFRYLAIDSAGKQLQGTIQAKDISSAELILAQKGLQHVQFIHNEQQQNKIRNDSDYIRTKKVKESELIFFFSQAHSLSKAGINPAESYEFLAQRTKNPVLKEVALNLSQAAKEGKYVSTIFEQYIDAFPHHVCGIVRSGEAGGFVPEAYKYISEQMSDSNSFKRLFWFVRAASWQGIVAILFAVPLPFAFWYGFREGSKDEIFIKYKELLLIYSLPIGVAFLLLFLLIKFILMRDNFLQFRHNFIMRLPFGIGKRAQLESLKSFLWALKNMTHAGVPYSTAWKYAAVCAPNAVYALKLFEFGDNVHSETPLSTAMQNTNLFTPEYLDTLSIGEKAGDVVGALERILAHAEDEYEVQRARARGSVFRLASLIFLILAGVVIIAVLGNLYGRMIEETDVTTIDPHFYER